MKIRISVNNNNKTLATIEDSSLDLILDYALVGLRYEIGRLSGDYEPKDAEILTNLITQLKEKL